MFLGGFAPRIAPIIANTGIESLRERIFKRLELFVSAQPANDSSKHSINRLPPVTSPFTSGDTGSDLNAANPPEREATATVINENIPTAELGLLNRRARKDRITQRTRAVRKAVMQPIKTENNALFTVPLSLLR